ncbi:MAG TPA: methyl-coenzyme M reductase family protein, partial [Methanosarcina vacuolata]|nr:methyl-coenzyme M reductase family protein [Methanosarcina vacuolata]
MAVLRPYLYTGGVHKHGLLIELLEDLGGYIVQKVVT